METIKIILKNKYILFFVTCFALDYFNYLSIGTVFLVLIVLPFLPSIDKPKTQKQYPKTVYRKKTRFEEEQDARHYNPEWFK